MLPATLSVQRAPLASLLIVASVCVLRTARAEEGVTGTARLWVDASSPCASRDELIARVRSRAPAVRFVDKDASLLVSAKLSVGKGGAIVGDVSFISNAAEPSARRVQANSCAEATDALALIIALTLDPTASRAEARPDEAATSTSQQTTPTSPVRGAKVNVSKAPGAPDSAGRGKTSFGLQLAAQAFFGPAPQVMPGVAVYGAASLERGRLWSPSVSIGATHAWQSETQEAGGKAAFMLDAVSFDACPLRVRLGSIQARPCASVLMGRLSARGSETTNQAAESRRAFWVVGGAAVASAELFWRLEASARVAVGANLVRDSFEFTPRVFHTVSSVTVAASLAVGMRWQ